MSDSSVSAVVIYTIDKKNKIIDIGGSWQEAAQQGNADHQLSRENVIGKPIEDFVCSDETQMYYDAIFKLCRLKKQAITRKYRCDSPSHKRYMRVTLKPLKNGSIELYHETLKEDPFENTVTTYELKSAIEPNSGSISLINKRCSMCNRIQPPQEKTWYTPEELSKHDAVKFQVIHTVCIDCRNIDWTKPKRCVIT